MSKKSKDKELPEALALTATDKLQLHNRALRVQAIRLQKANLQQEEQLLDYEHRGWLVEFAHENGIHAADTLRYTFDLDRSMAVLKNEGRGAT